MNRTTYKIPLMTPLRWVAFGLAAFAAPQVVAQVDTQLRFRIVGEEQTWASSTGAGSEYIAAQAVAGPTRPVVMAGNFDSAVDFPVGTSPFLTATAGVASVFAGVLDYDPIDSRWEVGLVPQQVDKLEPRSTVAANVPSAMALDLAVVDRNQYYVAGLIHDGTYFRNRLGTDFSSPPTPSDCRSGVSSRVAIAEPSPPPITSMRRCSRNPSPRIRRGRSW